MPSISANLTLLAWVSVVENHGSNSNPYLMVPIAIRQPHKASCPQIQTNRAYPAFSFMEANWKPEEPWAMVFKDSVCWREENKLREQTADNATALSSTGHSSVFSSVTSFRDTKAVLGRWRRQDEDSNQLDQCWVPKSEKITGIARP